VNTLITFGASGLESAKYGTITGNLTINGGGSSDNNYIILSGLGTAMLGDFTVDGKGGKRRRD